MLLKIIQQHDLALRPTIKTPVHATDFFVNIAVCNDSVSRCDTFRLQANDGRGFLPSSKIYATMQVK